MSKISVVMSVYNGERYLRESIESILNQTEKDFEFIIIDDGSHDASLPILKEYAKADARIKLITRENKGLIFSLNEGIEIAQSAYIARMDADDIALPDRLQKQLAYMVEHELVLCGSWATAINASGDKIKDMEYPPTTDAIRTFTLLHCPYIHPSVIFKKEVFQHAGGYKSFFKHIEDYELWTRIVFKYKTGNIPEALLRYRIHDSQITKKYHTKMIVMGVLVRVLALFRFLTNR